MSYQPPYTITDAIVTKISEISEKLGHITSLRGFASKPHLRRNNLIRSIHSSLTIEANSLSLDEIKSVISGKTVVGPENEIQEVKNAYAAYEQIGEFDYTSIDALKRIHGIMTHLTVRESGEFRRGNEGVFRAGKCIFMAPPPHMVSELISSLFSWMKTSAVHPLILACVFHYEFVFIHPFSDGNGRMARLWQTAILSAWNPIFKFLPIESRIQEFQDDYYKAIDRCNSEGNSTFFIEFMLDKIDLTLDWALNQLSTEDAFLPAPVRSLLDIMEYGVPYTASMLMNALFLKSKDNFRKLYLAPALKRGLIIMGIPDKPTSKNQTYIKI